MSIAIATALGLMVAMGIALARAFAGPTIFDRILAANVAGTKTVLLIALIGFHSGRADMYVDIALLYALINFVTTLAVLKFMHYPDVHWEPLEPEIVQPRPRGHKKAALATKKTTRMEPLIDGQRQDGQQQDEQLR